MSISTSSNHLCALGSFFSRYADVFDLNKNKYLGKDETEDLQLPDAMIAAAATAVSIHSFGAMLSNLRFRYMLPSLNGSKGFGSTMTSRRTLLVMFTSPISCFLNPFIIKTREDTFI
jgi:hypothetical protein